MHGSDIQWLIDGFTGGVQGRCTPLALANGGGGCPFPIKNFQEAVFGDEQPPPPTPHPPDCAGAISAVVSACTNFIFITRFNFYIFAVL